MKTRSIYIVDDDDSIRNSLHSLLSVRSDLLIDCFNSGSAFLQRAGKLDPGVLILDSHMPGVRGVDVLRTIDRGRFMTIMLTGQANVGLAIEVMRAGAVDLLEKPCDPDMLLQAVDAAFEKLKQVRGVAARTEAAQRKIQRLSERERAVLDGLIKGQANKVIAYELEISPRTVEIHRAKLMEKLEVRSLSEALRISFAAGIVPFE